MELFEPIPTPMVGQYIVAQLGALNSRAKCWSGSGLGYGHQNGATVWRGQLIQATIFTTAREAEKAAAHLNACLLAGLIHPSEL